MISSLVNNFMTSLNTFDLEMTRLVPVDEVRNVQIGRPVV